MIGKAIKYMRIKKGLKQEQIGKIIDKDSPTKLGSPTNIYYVNF